LSGGDEHCVFGGVVGSVFGGYFHDAGEKSILIILNINNLSSDSFSERLGDEEDADVGSCEQLSKLFFQNCISGVFRNDDVIALAVFASLADSGEEEASNRRLISYNCT